MDAKKATAVFLLILVTAVVGTYVSGLLTLFAAKIPLNQIELTSYWTILGDLNEASKARTKVLQAGVMGHFVALSGLLFILYLIFKPKENLHGNARFAHIGELKKEGFLTQKENSVVVGKFNNDFLFYSGQQFAILAAPTRSGKGVGIVIPNLLSYSGSVVVLDIKQENFDLTSGFREANGQDVFLFNPFAEDGRTHRWNPLSYVSKNPKFRVSDLSSLAVMLYPVNPDGKDQFFKNQAQNCFIAFALYILEGRDYQADLGCPDEFLPVVSIGAMYRLSSGDGTPIKDFLESLASLSFVSEEAKTAFRGMLSQNPEVFASILGTFKEPLLPWLNPVVDAATSGDDFWLTDVRKKRMSIYIGVLPNKLAESKLMINLFFSQLINENTKELPQNNPELRHQCLLLMDEFTSIGRVDIISKSVSYMAGYNLRLFPIIQSLAQLDSVYGKEDSRTLITNHALQIIYTPRIQSDANDYSEMLGYVSVDKENKTIAKQGSRSVSKEKRALMLPQELKAMSPNKEILIYEGIPNPIMCNKIKYYTDEIFKSRLLPKTNINILNV
jgi:type IV secretion system protein VirD4